MNNLFGSSVLTTTLLLLLSNLFMTFAWYAHLKNLADKPWYIAALFSWASRYSNISCKSRQTGSAIRR